MVAIHLLHLPSNPQWWVQGLKTSSWGQRSQKLQFIWMLIITESLINRIWAGKNVDVIYQTKMAPQMLGFASFPCFIFLNWTTFCFWRVSQTKQAAYDIFFLTFYREKNNPEINLLMQIVSCSHNVIQSEVQHYSWSMQVLWHDSVSLTCSFWCIVIHSNPSVIFLIWICLKKVRKCWKKYNIQIFPLKTRSKTIK